MDPEIDGLEVDSSEAEEQMGVEREIEGVEVNSWEEAVLLELELEVEASTLEFWEQVWCPMVLWLVVEHHYNNQNVKDM